MLLYSPWRVSTLTFVYDFSNNLYHTVSFHFRNDFEKLKSCFSLFTSIVYILETQNIYFLRNKKCYTLELRKTIGWHTNVNAKFCWGTYLWKAEKCIFIIFEVFPFWDNSKNQSGCAFWHLLCIHTKFQVNEHIK